LNFLANIPKIADNSEIIEVIQETNDFFIERIISSNHSSPEKGWYSQNHDEWVMLLQGSATIEFENSKQIDLTTFDTLHISAYTKHKVIYTSTQPYCIWLAIHSKHTI